MAMVLESAEAAYILKTEPGQQNVPVDFGVFCMASSPVYDDVIRYAIERRPAAEVLFNKMKELGHVAGLWDALTPVDRASFELAARIIPAVADVAEVMNAEMVRRFPPPAPMMATREVDLEDTILERVDGIDDIDPQMAAARAQADQAAAEREAEKAKKATAKAKKSARSPTPDRLPGARAAPASLCISRGLNVRCHWN
ncbi:hypothetical protein ACFSKM_07880 [Ancylobacter dichloromethanicus]